MNTPQYFQKISAGVSLVILAIGFSAIGLLSIIHGPLSSDSLDLSATSCTIGGFAGLGAGSIFFCAAFAYWRRYSWIAAQLPRPMALFSNLSTAK